MTSFNNTNEMNEDFGYSYFSFGQWAEKPTTTNSEGDRMSSKEFEDKHTDKPQEAIHSMIEWHDDITRVNVNSVVLNAQHFGILRISTPKTPISTTPLAILLNIDGSSSMDEISSGKLTKINHIKHTLKNMIHVLIDKITETPNICIYISILLFTHDVTNLLQRIKTEKQFEQFKDDFILLNHQSMHLILEEIDRIRPWGCTNIEISLKNAKTKINDLKTKNPEFRIAHIQLTDGKATAGKKHASELSSCVDTSYRNIFVGYGEEHDGHLLASLGEIYPTCDYRFIDNIERTGMVYGEIMYHLLYPHNDQPIWIKMSPGTKIYNWKTNQWTPTLIIPPLSSDTEKVFQIIIDNTGNISKEDVWADLYYTNNVFIPIESAITLPSLITLPIKLPRSTHEVSCGKGNEVLPTTNSEGDHGLGEKLPVNLTKYLLRQLTLECLYLVRNHESNYVDTMYPHNPSSLRRSHSDVVEQGIRSNTRRTTVSAMPLEPPPLIRSTNHVDANLYDQSYLTIDELQNKLSSNINLLISHRDTQNTDDDDVLFIQTLIDDLQTALTNLGSTHCFMYTTARQTSQGSQHTYSPYNTRYSGQGAERTELLSPKQASLAEDLGRRYDTNTYDLYNHDVRQHNLRQTSYTNRDILNMMTQVQGMDDSMYVSDVENDISDSLDNLSQEPVVYNTHVHIPFPDITHNSSGSEDIFRVSSDDDTRSVCPQSTQHPSGASDPLPRIRADSVNSESTVNTLLTQLMYDDITDED